MPVTGPKRAALQFGVFELDPINGELRKHGLRLRLPDQPLQILAALLERPGEIVTRNEIQKRLWPAGTYVDYDNAINGAVRKLRVALGDNAERARFIETLARRGYRFIAPVSMSGGKSSGGVSAQQGMKTVEYVHAASLETGIRIALGAQRGSVVWLVLRDVGFTLALGIVIGIVVALFAGRLVTKLLYGLQPGNPLTLILSAIVLALAASAAGYLPARRASRLDPMTALREE
jgi:DNA-binding winged helix-turn-helix (wHTH) protein